MLWLALHLTWLPLEVFTRGLERCGPVLVAETGSRAQVLMASRAAEKLGIRPGMPVEAARALGQELLVCRRDPRREAAALAGLAAWAGQFTPHVSLESDGLLLEIAGSRKLFGGAEKLRERVAREVRALGYHARCAVAPTPRAATWLARAGSCSVILDPTQLAQALAPLPLQLVEAAQPHADLLMALGVTTLGDCLALPRGGMEQRFGAAFLKELDMALGQRPDPRPWFTPPPRFLSRLELPAEVQETHALLFAARRLLSELEGFLRGREAGVEQFQLDLLHGDAPPTRVTVGLVTARRDVRHLLDLLRERLERLSLAQPVRELVLRAAHILPCQPRNLELFPTAESEAEHVTALIERLRARLGDGMVHSLECVADHRPERAMKAGEPGAAHQMGAPSRPLWLLPRPRPLACREGRPYLGAPLRIEAGPERIETGWWDGRPVARDYFVAEAVGGPRYWVYREAAEVEKWFLHGIFA
ncbi:Y-family DNA polymerase [Thiobacter aerophilum]|uniref:DNA polymerase Y family protein n=1 Tax=Thiobacter aerophilum TaxID=3121275 RepID=A0ABV0EEJ9_9BURK